MSAVYPPSNQSRVGGSFIAYNYGLWSIPITSIAARTGAQTFTVQTATVDLQDGRKIQPFAVGTPIRIGLETVTPTAVYNATLGDNRFNVAQITATLTLVHTNADVVSSGTFGLQEALNDASACGGGSVVLDSAWAALGGTAAMISAATMPTNTGIEDKRVSGVSYQSSAPYLGVGSTLNQTNYPNTLASFIGTSGSNDYTQVVTQDLNPQGSASLVMGGDNMTNTTHYANVSMNGSGSSRSSVNVYFTNANAACEYTTDAELDYGVGLVTGSGVINWYVNQATTANMALTSSGLNLVTGTFTNPNGTVGITGGGSAAAGINGEVISSTKLIGSAVSLTMATPANVTSIALTAGDWDVQGQVTFVAGSASIIAGGLFEAGINSTTATLPVDGSEAYQGMPTAIVTTSFNQTVTIARKVINISAGATQYLVAEATFTAGTVTAYGNITARRIR